MKNGILAGYVKKLMNSLTGDYFGGASTGRSAVLDLAALKVAMAVAALDGDVTESELAEFERLADTCVVPAGEAREKLFESCLRFAGYIEIQARRLDRDALVGLFATESFDALPPAFFRGDMSHVRRAFAMWVAIAMSDDYFESVERLAIGRLRERIAGAIAAVDEAAVPVSVSSFAIVPGAAAAGGSGIKTRQPPTDGFFARLEEVIARLKRDDTREAAEAELEQLIRG